MSSPPRRLLVAILVLAGASVVSETAQARSAPQLNNPSDKAAIARKCSVEADLRGLRGQERARFRNKCKRRAP